jgi:hypothetical protein
MTKLTFLKLKKCSRLQFFLWMYDVVLWGSNSIFCRQYKEIIIHAHMWVKIETFIAIYIYELTQVKCSSVIHIRVSPPLSFIYHFSHNEWRWQYSSHEWNIYWNNKQLIKRTQGWNLKWKSYHLHLYLSTFTYYSTVFTTK